MTGPPPWAPGYRHRSADVAPIACGFRERLEDFRVEEVPLYEPLGTGEHVLLRVEKRGLPTEDAVRKLARALGVRPGDVGWAGRKDARAVAVQQLSVAGVTPEAALAVELPGLRVLAAARHPHKLRRGQLAGNRFQLRLRGVDEDPRADVAAVLARVARDGLPNVYGAQRFGRGGRGHELGLRLVRGDHAGYLAALAEPPHVRAGEEAEALRAHLAAGRAPSRAVGDRLGRRLGPPWDRVLRTLRRTADPGALAASVPTPLRVLHVSAVQAWLFNALLFERFDDVARPGRGDVAWLHASGACFVVEDENEARTRAAGDDFELSLSGPMWGPRTLRATGAGGALEEQLLERAGVRAEDFARTEHVGRGAAARGARRPLRVPLREVSWELADGVLDLRFRLPPGSYATTLVEELRKEAAVATPGSPVRGSDRPAEGR